MTFEETLGALAIIVEFYPHSFSVTDAGPRLWHQELEAYDADDVYRAVRHLCRTKDAFPSLKDVVERLGPALPGAAEAWGQITAWAAHAAKGPLFQGGQVIDPPDLPPALAEAVKGIGDAATIAGRSSVEDGVMRAHFFRAYEEQVTKKRSADAVAAIEAPRPAPARPRHAAGHIADVLRQALPPGGAA